MIDWVALAVLSAILAMGMQFKTTNGVFKHMTPGGQLVCLFVAAPALLCIAVVAMPVWLLYLLVVARRDGKRLSDEVAERVQRKLGL